MADTGMILRGVAALLGTLDGLTYRPPGQTYEAGENPVTFGVQHATAATTVTVTHYLDTPTDTQATHQRFQVRTRHPHYLDGLDLVDAIRDTLHNQRYVDLGGITVSRVLLHSFIPLGTDASGRHEWAQNFNLLYGRRPAQQSLITTEETP